MVAVCLHSLQLCTRIQSALFRFHVKRVPFISSVFWGTALWVCKPRIQIELRRNISVTSVARCRICVYNQHILVMYIHSEEEWERERRQWDNFLSPSPARGILYFYWTFEMVRVWSYDPVGQWNVLLGKLWGERSFNMLNSLDDLN